MTFTRMPRTITNTNIGIKTRTKIIRPITYKTYGPMTFTSMPRIITNTSIGIKTRTGTNQDNYIQNI